MDGIKKALLHFVKCSLSQQGEKIELNKEECDEIFKIAVGHQIHTMVYNGMFLCGIHKDILASFENTIYSSIFHNYNQLHSIEILKREFSQADINYSFLKGSVLKQIYPSSEYRIMGDIDCLIDYKRYNEIRGIMLKLGYMEGKETDHELHWHKTPNIHIELHKHLIPSYNYDYYSYYGEGWGFFFQKDENTNEYRMNKEDELVYLFTHLTKHYRDGGIGLRHFIDLYVHLNYYEDINQEYVEKELIKLELLDFYHNVINTLNYWFEDFEENEIVKFISDRVFGGNAYGNRRETDIAKAVRNSKHSSNIFFTQIKYILKLIFMPYGQMIKKYSILQSKPILLPVFWVVRWVEAIFIKKENVKKEMENISLINRNDIEVYEEGLRKVGLKFFDKNSIT